VNAVACQWLRLELFAHGTVIVSGSAFRVVSWPTMTMPVQCATNSRKPIWRVWPRAQLDGGKLEVSSRSNV